MTATAEPAAKVGLAALAAASSSPGLPVSGWSSPLGAPAGGR
ncbi:hypothetical protein I551_8697 [Mycobacterium ulcerans str. Harvey]|uniref:Uncharacterized protein n=1 Tax=Mycobacterium ulcerans str. Harvey TaxID=1299332 RepID=A0ABN0RAA1_MYCUL|nr:hypothetical protein I551_8697 [Mycobacterium ulcerans str. Harvey]